MSADDLVLCECGHRKAAHPPKAWSGGGVPTPCAATIHVERHAEDDYSYPCPCRQFRPAQLPLDSQRAENVAP